MDPDDRDMRRNMKIAAWYDHVKGGCFGTPEKCPCGEDMTIKEIDGTRYYICRVYKDVDITDAHFKVEWVHAIQEEVEFVRSEVNAHCVKIRSFANLQDQIKVLRAELKNNVEDMRKLKDLVGRLGKCMLEDL